MIDPPFLGISNIIEAIIKKIIKVGMGRYCM